MKKNGATYDAGTAEPRAAVCGGLTKEQRTNINNVLRRGGELPYAERRAALKAFHAARRAKETEERQ